MWNGRATGRRRWPGRGADDTGAETERMMTQTPRTRLEAIQVLRGIAVLFVVMSHALHEVAALLAGRVRGFDDKLFPGDFGVDLFFVISGFIMVHVSRDAFARPGAVLDFVRRRIIRIVPLYWLMTTAMIAVVMIVPGQVDTATGDPGQWLASYLFVPYARMSDGLVRPVLGLGWSLQYEMVFYALFALGLFLPMRLALPFTTFLLWLTWLGANESGGSGALARFAAHPILLEFVSGMVLGAAYVSGARIARSLCAVFVIAGIVLLMLAPGFDEAVDLHRHVLYGIPATLIAAGAILFPGNESYRAPKVLLGAGEASYATYLSHPFVLGALAVAADRLALGQALPPVAFAAVFIAAAAAASLSGGYLVHRFVDLPATRRAAALIPAPRRAGAVQA